MDQIVESKVMSSQALSAALHVVVFWHLLYRDWAPG